MKNTVPVSLTTNLNMVTLFMVNGEINLLLPNL